MFIASQNQGAGYSQRFARCRHSSQGVIDLHFSTCICVNDVLKERG